jgi:hypothetical protein
MSAAAMSAAATPVATAAMSAAAMPAAVMNSRHFLYPLLTAAAEDATSPHVEQWNHCGLVRVYGRDTNEVLILLLCYNVVTV